MSLSSPGLSSIAAAGLLRPPLRTAGAAAGLFGGITCAAPLHVFFSDGGSGQRFVYRPTSSPVQSLWTFCSRCSSFLCLSLCDLVPPLPGWAGAPRETSVFQPLCAISSMASSSWALGRSYAPFSWISTSFSLALPLSCFGNGGDSSTSFCLGSYWQTSSFLSLRLLAALLLLPRELHLNSQRGLPLRPPHSRRYTRQTQPQPWLWALPPRTLQEEVKEGLEPQQVGEVCGEPP